MGHETWDHVMKVDLISHCPPRKEERLTYMGESSKFFKILNIRDSIFKPAGCLQK